MRSHQRYLTFTTRSVSNFHDNFSCVHVANARPRSNFPRALCELERTRTRTNTIPDGTKASAAGLSGCARVTRRGQAEKGEVWDKRRSARRLSEQAWVVKPVRACLWGNAFFMWCSPAGVMQGTACLWCVLGTVHGAWVNSARPRSPSGGRTSTPPTTEETRQYTGALAVRRPVTRMRIPSPTRDVQGGWKETPPQTKTSSSSIMNCFQHTPGSCGALHNPCGGAPHKESISPQTCPNRLHNPHLLNQAPCTSAFVQAPPPFRLTSCVLHTHTHLTPQHWLLCHLG